MMMNCFCGMVDQRKAFSLISSGDHCQRSTPLLISDAPWAGFKPVQNLISGLVEWSCAVMITITPRCHMTYKKVRVLIKHDQYQNHSTQNILIKTFDQYNAYKELQANSIPPVPPNLLSSWWNDPSGAWSTTYLGPGLLSISPITFKYICHSLQKNNYSNPGGQNNLSEMVTSYLQHFWRHSILEVCSFWIHFNSVYR